jgi:hypothetical protein
MLDTSLTLLYKNPFLSTLLFVRFFYFNNIKNKNRDIQDELHALVQALGQA